MKGDAETQKIIMHLVAQGSFKHCNEIEGSNPRLNARVGELYRSGALTKDKRGHYVPDDNKWEDFQSIKDNFEMFNGFLRQITNGQIDFKEKKNMTLLRSIVPNRGNTNRILRDTIGIIKTAYKK